MTDPRLDGTWDRDKIEEGDNPIELRIKKEEKVPTYTVTMSIPSETQFKQIFRIRLVRLNGDLFADAEANEVELNDQKIAVDDLLMLPVHIFARIWFEGDHIRGRAIDDEWVSNALKEKHISLRAEKIEGNLVLFDGTPELQKFVQEYAHNEEVFKGRFSFTRRK